MTNSVGSRTPCGGAIYAESTYTSYYHAHHGYYGYFPACLPEYRVHRRGGVRRGPCAQVLDEQCEQEVGEEKLSPRPHREEVASEKATVNRPDMKASTGGELY